MAKRIIFQLGTNNWQREGEFAPGSGILHEAHHQSMCSMENTKCFSVYPSSKQKGTGEEGVRVFKIDHDIPICESISPVSSYRWHAMSDDEFEAYRKRLDDFVTAYIDEIEAAEGPITHAIAHHSFLNPIIINDVNNRRVANGKAKIPFSVFVHGTALKMFENELRGDNQKEFPMRFTTLVRKEMALNHAKNVFIISSAEKDKLLHAYPELKAPIILSPNGVNMKIFCPPSASRSKIFKRQDSDRFQVLGELKTAPYEGSGEEPTSIPTEGWGKMVAFVGKFADWKRLDCLLRAAAIYEKSLGKEKVVTIIAGSGPLDAQKEYMDMAKTLGLTGTYFIGPQPQPVLAKLYGAADIGVFPSFHEPMGMVFIECMACGTPTIGADSGGPRDFVSPEVGALIPETPALGEDRGRFIDELASTITKACVDDWKGKKGPAALQLAINKYSTKTQVVNMVKTWESL